MQTAAQFKIFSKKHLVTSEKMSIFAAGK